MAATDKPYRSSKVLDYVFAGSCVLLLLSTLWMFVQDYNREFKSVQREFRDVETALNERMMLDKMPDPEAVQAKQKAVAEARTQLEIVRASLSDRERELSAERAQKDNTYRTIKADYDSRMSYYDIEVEELGKAQAVLDEARAAAKKVSAAEMKSQETKIGELATAVRVKGRELNRLKGQLDRAKKDLEETDQEIRKEIAGPLADPEKQLAASEDDLKQLTATFDRFAKSTAQRKWKLGDTIRALPILDSFESPIKIKQIVLPELTIDYGGFRDVPRYDRCTTCHLGIDRASFTRAALTSLGDVAVADKKLTEAREFLIGRQKSKEDLGFDPYDLPTKARALNLSPAQITEYCVHPRLDLFVDANSPHPVEKYGCTSCHAGQGSATDFIKAVHTPGTYEEEEKWKDKLSWAPSHDWDFPMLPKRFIESTCLKCHHQVTDLIRHGTKEEAPKLLRGFNLLRENGCFGCHEIAGNKGGRSIGPDVRLEPTPALDLLSPLEQDRIKTDAANPPGAYRKVGPALRRLADKTNEVWTRKWLLSPRSFREDTRMPHFYGLSNDSPDLLPADQARFPAAEIHSITHYLFEESKSYLKGSDTIHKAVHHRFNDLQTQLKTRTLTLKERKELIDLTRRLYELGLLSRPDRATEMQTAYADLKSAQDKLLELLASAESLPARKAQLESRQKELEAKGDNASAAEKKELEWITTKAFDQAEEDLKRVQTELPQTKNQLNPRADKLLALAQPFNLEKEIILGDGTVVSEEEVKKLIAADPKTVEARRIHGRVLFTERGCLACHANKGTAEPMNKKIGDKDYNIPALESEANFGPNLSRIAAKISADPTGRRWLLQWVLNPNVHFPRTRMPITHLSAAEAADVGEWLLSQEATGWDEKDPREPERLTLVRLARVYLSKVTDMTSKDVDQFLPGLDENAADKASGIPAERLQFLAADADEQVLVSSAEGGTLASDKLKWYIGKKSIGRLGCYGCHDIPGFEAAKPIGTALNDWGKKDGARLAFEDSDAFVKQSFNLVNARDSVTEPGKPAEDWFVQDGKKPFEKYFLEMLEHHQREGFLHLKLMEPRSFDFNRRRAWDDRLRMPQFRFSRVHKLKDESAEDFENRQSYEEAIAREAVMTFVLGLVAEPVTLKYVYNPGTDKKAVVKGRQVLDKFNCGGCHLIQPGVYEFKDRPGSITLLEDNYRLAAGQFATDHPFLNHNAWVGTSSNIPGRLIAYGAYPREPKKEDPEAEDELIIRLVDALRFRASDGVDYNLPAASFARIAASDVLSRSDPFGGIFGNLLVAREYAKKMYGDRLKTPDDARAVLPPPLIREGERIQPKWLYQFLLNPGVIRPQGFMLLRMPKFNMSPDDAQALVNYFGAVDKLGNPGIGLTYPYLNIAQRDKEYWHERTAEYTRRLGKEKVAAKVKRMLPLWEGLVNQQLTEAKAVLESARAALKNSTKPENKADLEKGVAAAEERIKSLQAQVDKKDFAKFEERFVKEEVYATDAFHLLTNRELCLKCHNIGAIASPGAQGPNLAQAFERLRPEWALEWIANPARMFPYQPLMPLNFPKNNKEQYNEVFEGTPLDKIQAVRDVLLDLPRLIDLPGNRSPQAPAVATGEKK